MENVMVILLNECPIAGLTICDTDCVTGSLSILFANDSAIVSANEIFVAMVVKAKK